MFVLVNAAIVLAAARREFSHESLAVVFAIRIGVNVALVALAWFLLGRGDINVGNTLFFVLLLSLITTLHDAWQPIHGLRARAAPPAVG